jgi:hypothetical protein
MLSQNSFGKRLSVITVEKVDLGRKFEKTEVLHQDLDRIHEMGPDKRGFARFSIRRMLKNLFINLFPF